MKAVLNNGIYVMQACTLCGEAAATKEKAYDKYRPWHLRMTHKSEQGQKKVSKKGILGEGKVADVGKSESCRFGKATKVKFSKKALNSSIAPLEAIH